MNTLFYGLREGALTVAYNAIVVARGAMRRVVRPTTVGVRVVIPRGDQVVLVRHRGGRRPWALPGGGVNRFETLPEAALREAHEEAGCEARVERLLGVFHSFAEGMTNFTAVFVCTPLGEVQAPRGDLEIVDARYFSQQRLPEGTEQGSARRVAEYAAGENSMYGPW
jgi:ADP-ribose pyrophosphatase YjhB (NUDIX family)